VEDTIAAAAMFVAAVNTTATVRSPQFADWDDALVVTPEAIVSAQNVFFTSVADAAVTTSVASVAPELLDVMVKVVLPQPLAEGVATVPQTKLGSTMDIWSFTFRSAFDANENVSDDTADVTGTAIARIDSVRVGSVNAVDSMMAAAAILADPARVAAAVLVATFAD
jgi:hypothetical protein